MSHFVEQCKNCGRVIGQCRCIGHDKEIRYSICDSCKDELTNLPATESIDEALSSDDMIISIQNTINTVQSEYDNHLTQLAKILANLPTLRTDHIQDDFIVLVSGDLDKKIQEIRSKGTANNTSSVRIATP